MNISKIQSNLTLMLANIPILVWSFIKFVWLHFLVGVFDAPEKKTNNCTKNCDSLQEFVTINEICSGGVCMDGADRYMPGESRISYTGCGPDEYCPNGGTIFLTQSF